MRGLGPWARDPFPETVRGYLRSPRFIFCVTCSLLCRGRNHVLKSVEVLEVFLPVGQASPSVKYRRVREGWTNLDRRECGENARARIALLGACEVTASVGIVTRAWVRTPRK